MYKSNRRGTPFILLTALWIIILVILPLAYLLYVSFVDYNLLSPAKPFVGLQNYQLLFSDQRTLDAFVRTFFFAISSTAITLLLGTIAAWVFSYDLPGIRFLRSLFTIPLFTASVAVATMARFLFSRPFGIFPDLAILADRNLAGYGLIAVDAWQWTPMVFVVVLNALRVIPTAEYDAARLDTKSDTAIFSFVAFPRVRRALLVVAILRLIDSLQMFDLPFVLTQGGPANSTQTIALALYDNAFRFFNLGYAAALAVGFLMIIAVLAIIFFRVTGRRFKIIAVSHRTSLQSYLEALRSQ